MKTTIRRALVCIFALALIMPVEAQFFDHLIKSAEKSAEKAVEKNVNKAVQKGVDKAFDAKTYQGKKDKGEAQEGEEQSEPQEQPAAAGWTCPACGAQGNTGKFCTECGAKKPEGDGSWTCPQCGHQGNTGKFCTECGAKKPGEGQPAARKNAESAYAKSDFVRGDEVFFEDDFANEQLGEFPSKWDVNDGAAEVASVNGQKYMLSTEWYSNLEPLMKNQKNWLPDQFTIEFDVYIANEGEDIGGGNWMLKLVSSKSNWNETVGDINLWWRSGDEGTNVVYGSMRKPDNETTIDGEETELVSKTLKKNDWNHCALSFNKRALKFYLNGIRIFQIPSMMAPEKIQFQFEGDYKYRGFANVVIAKGAVPLYNRLATEGRIITYGITFDIGKATIKEQSLPEINRILKLMNDNPDISFEVQGHTDNTGNAALNQALSEQRAAAIVAKLVEMGISPSRLSAKGFGQSSPIADNSTDEGRAKNRRVEFVKK